MSKLPNSMSIYNFLERKIGKDCFQLIIQYLLIEYGFPKNISFVIENMNYFKCIVYNPLNNKIDYKYLPYFSNKRDYYSDSPAVNDKIVYYVIDNLDYRYYYRKREIILLNDVDVKRLIERYTTLLDDVKRLIQQHTTLPVLNNDKRLIQQHTTLPVLRYEKKFYKSKKQKYHNNHKHHRKKYNKQCSARKN